MSLPDESNIYENERIILKQLNQKKWCKKPKTSHVLLSVMIISVIIFLSAGAILLYKPSKYLVITTIYYIILSYDTILQQNSIQPLESLNVSNHLLFNSPQIPYNRYYFLDHFPTIYSFHCVGVY